MKRFIHQYRVQILLSIYQSTINQSEQEPISTSKYPSNTRSNFQLVSKSIDKHRYLSQNRVKKNHLRFISKSLLKSHFLFRTKQKKKKKKKKLKEKSISRTRWSKVEANTKHWNDGNRISPEKYERGEERRGRTDRWKAVIRWSIFTEGGT